MDFIKNLNRSSFKAEPLRYKILHLDAKRTYFWHMILKFYDYFVTYTVDFDKYPYISNQLCT